MADLQINCARVLVCCAARCCLKSVHAAELHIQGVLFSFFLEMSHETLKKSSGLAAGLGLG